MRSGDVSKKYLLSSNVFNVFNAGNFVLIYLTKDNLSLLVGVLALHKSRTGKCRVYSFNNKYETYESYKKIKKYKYDKNVEYMHYSNIYAHIENSSYKYFIIQINMGLNYVLINDISFDKFSVRNMDVFSFDDFLENEFRASLYLRRVRYDVKYYEKFVLEYKYLNYCLVENMYIYKRFVNHCSNHFQFKKFLYLNSHLLSKIIIKGFDKSDWDLRGDIMLNKHMIIHNIEKQCNLISLGYGVDKKELFELSIELLGHLIADGFIIKKGVKLYIPNYKSLSYEEQNFHVFSYPITTFHNYSICLSYDSATFNYKKSSYNNAAHNNSYFLINKLNNNKYQVRPDFISLYSVSLVEKYDEFKSDLKFLFDSLKTEKNDVVRSKLYSKIKTCQDIIFCIRLVKMFGTEPFYFSFFSDYRGRCYSNTVVSYVYNKIIRSAITLVKKGTLVRKSDIESTLLD